jgi:hypothetical protein
VGNPLPECCGTPRLGPCGSGGVKGEPGLCCGSIFIGFCARFRLAVWVGTLGGRAFQEVLRSGREPWDHLFLLFILKN